MDHHVSSLGRGQVGVVSLVVPTTFLSFIYVAVPYATLDVHLAIQLLLRWRRITSI